MSSLRSLCPLLPSSSPPRCGVSAPPPGLQHPELLVPFGVPWVQCGVAGAVQRGGGWGGGTQRPCMGSTHSLQDPEAVRGQGWVQAVDPGFGVGGS